jgi:single-strand DNA-binding protein
LVYVEGRLQTRSWEGQDGQKRTTTEINAQDVQFLDTRGSGGGGGGAEAISDDEFAPTPGAVAGTPAPAGAAAAPSDGQDIDPDDIPF